MRKNKASSFRQKLLRDSRSDLRQQRPLPDIPNESFTSSNESPFGNNTYILDPTSPVTVAEHIYENPVELLVCEGIPDVPVSTKTDISTRSPLKKTSRLSNCPSKTSTMSSTLSSVDLDGGLHNRTLSSLEGELSGRGSACLSPATKIRLAADGNRVSTSDDDSGCALEAEYVWVPNGLRPDLVHQYFSCIPDGKVPLVNSAGEKWRVKQLLLQLPPHDCEPRYCRHLPQQDHKELKAFAAQRNRDALGRGTVKVIPYHMEGVKCKQCTECLSAGDLGVFAARFGENKVWHPNCFSCSDCNELLVDLIYFHKDGRLFCGRHHAECIKPRCSACDEIIFADECTEAEGRSWHMTHFACFECDAQLGGQRYVMRSERPYCVPCYQTMFAEVCVQCRNAIGLDQAHVTLENRQWHTDCFVCSTCLYSLQGKPFLPRKGNIYCGVDCCTVASSAPSPTVTSPKSSGRRSRSLGRGPGQSKHMTPVDSDSDSAPAADSDYETIASFNKLPINRERSRKNCDQRMTASVIHESTSKEHSCRTRHRRNRRHRSLTELNRQDMPLPPRPRHSKGSSRRSIKSTNSHVYEDLIAPEFVRSERSYAKAVQNNVIPSASNKIETTFGVDDSSSVTSSTRGGNRVRYASPMVTYHSVQGNSHCDAGCSTCSSSSEDEDDDYYMQMAMSLPRPRPTTPYLTSTRKSRKPKINPSANCIVS